MSRPLNILALVPDAWGGRGGVAQYNRDFLGALARSEAIGGITVVPRLAPDPAATPATVVQTPARRAVALYALAALRAAVTRPVDVVFCGHLHMAPLALAMARLRRARLIVQAHGVEVWSAPSPLRRAAVEAADLVLCVSRHTRTSVAGWSSTPPERLIVLPNTVSAAFSPGEGAGLRTSLGLDGKRVLLTVGRMVAHERQKGHDRVIEVLPQLVRAGHDAVYVVIGDGDDRARLEGLAKDAGVADRLIFLGAAPQDIAIEAYRMADLYVMPSAQEGFGIAFLEAMACGTPAIGLNVGGARDALADGDLGLLADEGGFAAAVKNALERPRPDRRELAGAVRRRFGQSVFEEAASGFVRRLADIAHKTRSPGALARA